MKSKKSEISKDKELSKALRKELNPLVRLFILKKQNKILKSACNEFVKDEDE